jgi:hypothetical protein
VDFEADDGKKDPRCTSERLVKMHGSQRNREPTEQEEFERPEKASSMVARERLSITLARQLCNTVKIRWVNE